MVPDTPRTLQRRMNIVFITIDAWRYDALGVAPEKRRLVHYGVADQLRTPNLDRFANEGIDFSNIFVTATPHWRESLKTKGWRGRAGGIPSGTTIEAPASTARRLVQ